MKKKVIHKKPVQAAQTAHKPIKAAPKEVKPLVKDASGDINWIQPTPTIVRDNPNDH